MHMSISMIALGSQLVVTVAGGVPAFDVVRSCKLDGRNPRDFSRPIAEDLY